MQYSYINNPNRQTATIGQSPRWCFKSEESNPTCRRVLVSFIVWLNITSKLLGLKTADEVVSEFEMHQLFRWFEVLYPKGQLGQDCSVSRCWDDKCCVTSFRTDLSASRGTKMFLGVGTTFAESNVGKWSDYSFCALEPRAIRMILFDIPWIILDSSNMCDNENFRLSRNTLKIKYVSRLTMEKKWSPGTRASLSSRFGGHLSFILIIPLCND